jgi:hypothetical protein
MLAELAGRAQATGGLRRDFVIDDLVLVLLAGRGLSTTPPTGRPAAARRLADAARTHLTLRDESTARLPEMTTGTLWLPAGDPAPARHTARRSRPGRADPAAAHRDGMPPWRSRSMPLIESATLDKSYRPRSEGHSCVTSRR